VSANQLGGTIDAVGNLTSLVTMYPAPRPGAAVGYRRVPSAIPTNIRPICVVRLPFAAPCSGTASSAPSPPRSRCCRRWPASTSRTTCSPESSPPRSGPTLSASLRCAPGAAPHPTTARARTHAKRTHARKAFLSALHTRTRTHLHTPACTRTAQAAVLVQVGEGQQAHEPRHADQERHVLRNDDPRRPDHSIRPAHGAQSRRILVLLREQDGPDRQHHGVRRRRGQPGQADQLRAARRGALHVHALGAAGHVRRHRALERGV
jgi:hypothetical protein